MPTPLDFMERVLPWPGPEGSGWGNLHWSLTKEGQKRWRGEPFKTAGALLNRAQKLTMAPPDKAQDIFYCTSIQRDTETINMPDGRSFAAASRHANTATLIKALFLDVDIKTPPKGYNNLNEALNAINQFCTAAGLPGPSAFVLSGGGVHVYWLSDRALTIAEWRPFAEGLKAEAMRLGLRADYGVTADPARILRVPGTFNRKIVATPRPVKVLGLGCDYDFAADLAGLKAIGDPLVTVPVTKTAPFDMSAFQGYKVNPALAASLAQVTDKLSDGIDRYVDLPLDPTEVIKGCGHFKDALLNNGKGHGQGLWMLTVLASTWFENGYDCAKTFSKGYPTYDEDEFQAMWDRKLGDRAGGLGWPSCKSFENEGCKSCATCAFRPLNKSPLNLATRVKPPEPDPTQQVVTNTVTNTVLTEADLRLPKGYNLSGGQIRKKVNVEKDPKAPPIWEYIAVFEGQVISKPQISAHVPPTLYFKYQQGPGNFMDVEIPYTAYASDQTLAAAFLGIGLLVNPDADKFVRNFMRSWVSKIDLATKRLNTAPLGWIIDNGIHTGFAFGGRLFDKSGAEQDSGTANEWFNKFMPSGEEGPIRKAMEVISQQMNPALEVLLLQSWASPLVDIAGLKTTAIVWGYSNGSGKGKSTALRTGMALWGSPDKCRDRGGATAIGMENKMDRLQNLPAQIDELKDNKAIDEVAAIFNRIGEGGQGAKGTRNGGLRADKFWQLILTCGSNKSLYDYQASKGQATDASAMRGFEVPVEPSTVPSPYTMTEIDQLIGSLEHNHGHLGLRYSKYLAMNRPAIDQRYQAIDKQTIADLTPPDRPLPNEERFWKTTVTLTLLAAELANLVTDKNYFHIDLIRKYLYDMYRVHRTWVAKHVAIAGTGLHSDEAWNKLMGLWINDQLVTDKMANGTGRSGIAVQKFVTPPYDRGHFTKIHWLAEPPMVRIAYTSLVDDLKAAEMGTAVVDEFQKLFGGKTERKVFLAGIPVPETKTRIKVWEIPITQGHPLYRQWADKVMAANPTPMSAAAQAQDVAKDVAQEDALPKPSDVVEEVFPVREYAAEEPRASGPVGLAAAATQAAKDLATVRGATGGAC